MAGFASSASALFLREAEVRHGLELLYFGYHNVTREVDGALATHGLGRAHHRAMYFIARQPDQSVSQLLHILAITKQSFGRVVHDLVERNLVEIRGGDRDRRQRLLRLTAEGAALESEFFEIIRRRMAEAYASAGQGAVGGYWAVLEGLMPADQRRRLVAPGD
ncbi:MAG: helix-turn-helix domain-containing protein [Sphingomonas sp.]|jgi:DNA-binding MarR family transcriptional regulator